MSRHFLQITALLLLTFLLEAVPSFSQYKIKGTVYDSSRTYPLELVSVLSTSGKGTVTDAYGDYTIDVGEKDSIWFSYLNKPTVKFPVLKIRTPLTFDISLQVNVPILREVRIRPKDYRQDSIQNRQDYAKIFDYKKPGLSVVTPSYGQAAGFDINEIINIFRFKRNRSIAAFQRRLLAQEQEKFVDHRFNKGLVRRLTGITNEAVLDSFMMVFRPPYQLTMLTADYEFQKYIKDSYERFKKGLLPMPLMRFKEEDDFE